MFGKNNPSCNKINYSGKSIIKHSNDMDYIYRSIEEYLRNKKREMLIIFGNMVADMISNKKLNPIVTEQFIRGRKLNISFVFITQSYFAGPKDIRLNSTPYFIIKILNKQEFQEIAFYHSNDALKTWWIFTKMFCKTIFSFRHYCCSCII